MDRADPVEILMLQARTRTPALVPIRYGRMLRSPFAFFRGAAAIMAADLAGTEVSGTRVQLCGDAHLANFGVFAAPDRRLVFDLNDFDETLPGPWEWDVKRLAASLEVAGRDRGFGGRVRRDGVRRAARSYRKAMRDFAAMRTIDVWYARLDVERAAAVPARGSTRSARTSSKAARQGPAQGQPARVGQADLRASTAEPRIVSDPPLVVPIARAARAPTTRDARSRERSAAYVRDYRRRCRTTAAICSAATASSTSRTRWSAWAAWGRAAWIVLLLGRDDADPLFLQVKEAAAVGARDLRGGPQPVRSTRARRVVEGQQLMQAASDVFLGWLRVERGPRRAPPRLLRPPAVGREGARRRSRRMSAAELARLRARSAAGRSPAPTRARATASRSPATSAASDGFDRALAALRRGLRRPERARPRRAGGRGEGRRRRGRSRAAELWIRAAGSGSVSRSPLQGGDAWVCWREVVNLSAPSRRDE